MSRALVFLLLAAGCGDVVDDTDTDLNTGACDGLAGETFSSTTEGECGLGPDGPVLCTWTIDFATDGTFSWMHSDYGVAGTWSCDGGTLAVTGAGAPESATYDAATGELVWDGNTYTSGGSQ